MSLSPQHAHSNENRPCVKARYRAQWRRSHWSLLTANRYKSFATLQEVLDHVRRLQQPRHATGPLQVRVEERDPRTGRWREIPELATAWAENGWPK